MIGKHAFCPKSGAPLSEEIHYEDQGRPQRVPLEDQTLSEVHPDGELTNGAIRSSKIALFCYFRRCHQHHHQANQSLYRKALLGLRRLKRSADGKQSWDNHIWYALQEWLTTDYEIDWMSAYTEPRCVHCHGQLKYKKFVDGEVYAQCGANCTGNNINQINEIREIIHSLCSQAFDDRNYEDTEFLQFL